MNENIKILWNLIEEGFEEMCPLEAQAIENLITNYQEQEVFIGKLLKENEDLRKNSVPVAKIEEEYLNMEKEYARKLYDKKYNIKEVKLEEMYKSQVYKKLLEEKKNVWIL